jgi:hypothetical protein
VRLRPTDALLRLIAAAFLILALPCAAQAQASAGTVEFVSGEALIRSASGQSRAATLGAAIGSGDTVETALGRLQMRMVDGAYISLQPRTLLRLDEYSTGAGGASEERGFLALLRGGLRTVTGTIGRVNRGNYRLTTPTATVGIRGTGFAATADNGTRVNVTEGIVALCNEGGCVDVGAGQSGFAPDALTRPALAFATARLPPTASGAPQSFALVAEQRTSSGSSAVLPAASTGTTSGQLPVVPLPNGAGGLAVASLTSTGGFSAGLLGVTLTFAASGALTQSIDCCTAFNNYAAGVSTDFGADGIIAWGRWSGGNGQGGASLTTMNYIAVVNANGVNAVTTPNIVRAYTSFASTAPTVTSGGSILHTGTPNSVTGSLNVNFPNWSSGGGTLTYSLNIPIPTAGQTFTITGTATQLGTGASFLGASSTISSTGTGCSTACAGIIPFGNAIQGTITGTSAQRAGANYGFTSTIGKVSGAVVFK